MLDFLLAKYILAPLFLFISYKHYSILQFVRLHPGYDIISNNLVINPQVCVKF